MAVFTLQANKKTTISGDFAAGATSLTLASAAFTNFTDGFLVVDYDNDSKFEIIKCTVTGTAVSSITRAQDGTSDVAHSSGAKIGFMFVPSHWTQFVSLAGSAAWSTWVPSTVGWTSATITRARYQQVGKIVHVDVEITGTSNSTSTTFTLPVAAKSAPPIPLGLTVDSGTVATTPGRLVLTAAGTGVTVFKDSAVASWTGSGTKTIAASFAYEAN